MDKNKNGSNKWLFVALLAMLLAVPNATFIKISVHDLDPAIFITLKAALASVVLLPFVFIKRKQFTRKALKNAALSGLCMMVATISYAFAIDASKASYALMLMLLVPIVNVLYAVKFDGRSVNHRSYAGMTLAAAGAFCIVGLPIIWHQQAAPVFYPLATLLMVLVVATFPLTVIFAKRAHQEGAPLMAVQGISSMVVFTGAFVLSLLTVDSFSLSELTLPSILGIVYSALAVSFAARVLSVMAYEHINVAVYSSLAYFEIFLAVLLPVMVLGEQLSREMVIGGILILLGIYAVEHHKIALHKHHHALRHH